MEFHRIIISLIYLCSVFAFEGNLDYLKSFDDSIIFQLNWEKLPETLLNNEDPLETVTMVTSRNEKYTCSLPKLTENKQVNVETPQYEGPNAIQLLSPLFIQKSCSYRLETFWTYELCHGRHIKQYHEEREGKEAKLQEYYLGYWDKDKMEQQSAELDAQNQNGRRQEVPVRKIESLTLPYHLVTMDGGTLCDLNGKPRLTRVYYVCYPAGKHEIFSLEEVSTCEYEVVVLTPHLCQHPDYRAKESEENKISCWPTEGSAKKPQALFELEAESVKLRQQNILDSLGLSDTRFKIEFRQVEEIGGQGQKQTLAFITSPDTDQPPAEEEKASRQPSQVPAEGSSRLHPPQPIFDPKLVEDFLTGEYCLHGGTGWWKYEFCYGRKVDQYHEDKDGSRTVIRLGSFHSEKHLSWLEQNPSKRPKPGPGRKQISHLYSEGSLCELTNSPRRVEVKLKCKELPPQNSLSPFHSQNAVSLYLLEPQPCEYVLGVEAPFLCSLIEAADNNAFIKLDAIKKQEEEKKVIDEKQEL